MKPVVQINVALDNVELIEEKTIEVFGPPDAEGDSSICDTISEKHSLGVVLGLFFAELEDSDLKSIETDKRLSSEGLREGEDYAWGQEISDTPIMALVRASDGSLAFWPVDMWTVGEHRTGILSRSHKHAGKNTTTRKYTRLVWGLK